MSYRNLSAKEELFCEYYKLLRSPREAAARAGFSFPERSGIRLLKKEAVKKAVESASIASEAAAADGLRRIAFGSVTDAVYLCTCGDILTREQLEALDLYMVSELKFTKGGGIEVKFFDRIKALDGLTALSAETVGSSAEPFYRALCEGAKNLASEAAENGV